VAGFIDCNCCAQANQTNKQQHQQRDTRTERARSTAAISQSIDRAIDRSTAH